MAKVNDDTEMAVAWAGKIHPVDRVRILSVHRAHTPLRARPAAAGLALARSALPPFDVHV